MKGVKSHRDKGHLIVKKSLTANCKVWGKRGVPAQVGKKGSPTPGTSNCPAKKGKTPPFRGENEGVVVGRTSIKERRKPKIQREEADRTKKKKKKTKKKKSPLNRCGSRTA